ncbi:MAG: hypothetical protein A2189_07395 [Paenibacillus sp. RIFOXYA1_FULL_44_5]|nr:MAG: hypothetical protein A2189_07395 [Paenibacillus sp. RIFOXYA1_FULL_44_5]
MTHFVRFITISLISLVIAFGLSVFPRLDAWMQQAVYTAVFRVNVPQTLNNRNLVNFMENIPLELSIRSVNLNGGIIKLDLSYNGDYSSSEIIYRDLYQTVYRALSETTNIQQVLIRVFLDSNDYGSDALLIYADVKRTDLKLDRVENPEAYVTNHFHITKTYNWSQLFRE